MDFQQARRRTWKIAFGWGFYVAVGLVVRYLFWGKLTFIQQLQLAALFAAAMFVVAYIAILTNRVKDLEKRVDSASMETVSVVNRMATAILRPTPVEAENFEAVDTQGALELIDHYIGHRLSNHVPALRRVLHLSIGLSFDLLRKQAGIADQDLKGLEDHFAQAGFCPTPGMVIEEWATHTVIIDYKGNRQVFYKSAPSWHDDPARVIWKHKIPRANDPWADGTFEVVLHDGYIRCWAVDGQFGRQIPPERVAKNEHVFISIPMDEGALTQYLVMNSSEDPEISTARFTWIRHYADGDPDEQFWWHLTVNDVVSYVRDRG